MIQKSQVLASLSVEELSVEPEIERMRVFAKHTNSSISAMASSIKSQGVVTPLKVTQNPSRSGYLVISGAGRLHAAKQAGLKEIPCVVVPYPKDPGQLVLIGMIENVTHDDMHDCDIAAAMKRLMGEGLFQTQKQMALALGLSTSRVSQLMAINYLPQECLNLIREYENRPALPDPEDSKKRITERHLRAICRLSFVPGFRRMQIEFTRAMIEKQWTAEEVEEAVNLALADLPHEERAQTKNHKERKRKEISVPGTPNGVAIKIRLDQLTIRIRFVSAEGLKTKIQAATEFLMENDFEPIRLLLGQEEVTAPGVNR